MPLILYEGTKVPGNRPRGKTRPVPARRTKPGAGASLDDRYAYWVQQHAAEAGLSAGVQLTAMHRDAYEAIWQVYGREPLGIWETSAIQGLITAGSEHAYSDMTLILSLNPEARRRGVDPTQFGNSIVDPAAVPDELKPYYDEWMLHHKDEPFYTGHLWLLDWQQEFGSVQVQQGLNDGTIKRGPNGEYIVTQEAVDTYGAANLQFGGAKPNDINMVPTDSGILVPDTSDDGAGTELYNAEDMTPEELANAQAYYQHFTDEGYVIRRTTGPEQHMGLFDYAVQDMQDQWGANEDWANFFVAALSGGAGSGAFLAETVGISEGYFFADPGNINTGWMWGDRGVQNNQEGLANLTGKDYDDYEDRQDVAGAQGVLGSIVQVAAAFIPVVGWAVAAGIGVGRTYSQAQLGRMDWDTAVVNASLSVLAAYLGANAGGDAGSLLSSGQNMAAQAAIAGAQAWNASAARGDGFDTGSILTAMAVSAASAYVSGAVKNYGMSHDFTQWGQTALTGASAFALDYLGSWYEDKQNPRTDLSGSELFSSALVSGASAAGHAYMDYEDAAAAFAARENAYEANVLSFEAARDKWERDYSAAGSPAMYDSESGLSVNPLTGNSWAADMPVAPKNPNTWSTLMANSFDFGFGDRPAASDGRPADSLSLNPTLGSSDLVEEAVAGFLGFGSNMDWSAWAGGPNASPDWVMAGGREPVASGGN